jgi:hypothetical protein
MNRDLEALIKAYDAWLEAGKHNIANQKAFYEHLEDEVSQRRNVSKETLRAVTVNAHGKWRKAHRRPPTIPPTA